MASLMTLFKAAAFTVVLSGAVAAKSSSDSLPVVDLGYELYRASDFNETGGYYSFSNIRYAAPPVGDLRWQLPQPPAVNRSAIQDNVGNRVCPQTTPPWLNDISWLAGYLRNGTVPNNTTSSSSAAAAPRDPSQNEDCLFLDVMVPQKIFEKTGDSPGAPVLVWIYGGGYGVGSKTNGYDARSLLSRSQANNNSSGVIFVAMNYRLGAFGFLSGPSFQASGGVPNLGFRDQRLALDWIQQHIHRFGGDKDRVTVMGESAGAGSIMHHLTAFGGAARAPFAQAVLQSPGWVPYPSRVDQEAFFRDFLRRANNASSLAAARALSTEQLMAANAAQMAAQPYGSFGASPCLDGDFVTQDPKPLLAQGKYDKRVRILAAHNADEGLLFTPPVADDAGYRRFVQDNFPAARRAQLLDYLAETLYPPVFDGSLPYTDHVERVALTIAEATFVCNTRAVAGRRGASESDTFAYFWDVFPGLHSQDVQYTFYNPDTTWVDAPLLTMWGTNETVAFAMQDWFTSFAITGKPESGLDGLEGAFPHYGEEATMVSLSWEGVGRLSDPGANERCEWWQLALVG